MDSNWKDIITYCYKCEAGIKPSNGNKMISITVRNAA